MSDERKFNIEDFDEYIRQREPDKKEKAYIWQAAIGLQAVDGLECIKAKMKLSVLQDNRHSDDEKEKRLKQIDIETHQMEEMMKNDLEYRGLLIP